jgi:hypothetical protein
MRIGLHVACVLLVCLPVLRAEDPPLAEDPWTGKSRDDVLTLLGEPTKKKADGKGFEQWTYKLVRLDPDLPPQPGVMVLNVPGIGMVGRLPEPGILTGSMTLESSGYDKEGNLRSGGWQPEEGASVSYGKDGKTVEYTDEKTPSVQGKLTLKFYLTGGRIERWSVSPKKALQGR